MKHLLHLLLLLLVVTVSHAQKISTAAGTGVQGYNGDGIGAASARLALPDGVAVDKAGNIFIADTYNHRIRKISKNGTITTIAGGSIGGYSGDKGPATSALLYYPEAVAVDTAGNIYIADFGNQVVRMINTAGIITTIAGNGSGGYSGDGGPATSAKLSGPYDVCLDTAGNIIIADWRNNRIRKVNKSGIISTVAGTGVAGYSGDGANAASAKLNNPYGVAVDQAGNIYIGDTYNNVIRKVSVIDNTITTFAGTGVAGSNGDSGPASAAELNNPIGIKIDTAGNVFFADALNNKIREVSAAGIITTVAGTGVQGYSGDGSSPLDANLNYPIRVAFDTAGNIYVSERNNNIIRKISGSPTTLPVTLTNFNAYTLDKGVQTAWTGFNEINVSGYNIERSSNGYQFNKVGIVVAKNNKAPENDYTWFDALPLSGDNYYRIKAISKDGTIQYSRNVLVKIGTEQSGVSIYPNPVENKTIQLHLNNIIAGGYTYVVYNAAGQKVNAGTYTHSGGNSVVAIKATGFAKGIYYVVLKGSKSSYSIKAAVQ